MLNFLWFHLLRCVNLLLFFVICDSKLNILCFGLILTVSLGFEAINGIFQNVLIFYRQNSFLSYYFLFKKIISRLIDNKNNSVQHNLLVVANKRQTKI